MELPMALIREYDPTTDYPALRMCFIELQAWEQSFEPGLPAPRRRLIVSRGNNLRRCKAFCRCAASVYNRAADVPHPRNF
jgi:hypothetical protein